MKDKKRSFCCDEQASGFSVLTADELYYVNGGCFSWGSAVAVGAGTGAMTGALEGAAGYFISIMFD